MRLLIRLFTNNKLEDKYPLTSYKFGVIDFSDDLIKFVEYNGPNKDKHSEYPHLPIDFTKSNEEYSKVEELSKIMKLVYDKHYKMLSEKEIIENYTMSFKKGNKVRSNSFPNTTWIIANINSATCELVYDGGEYEDWMACGYSEYQNVLSLVNTGIMGSNTNSYTNYKEIPLYDAQLIKQPKEPEYVKPLTHVDEREADKIAHSLRDTTGDDVDKILLELGVDKYNDSSPSWRRNRSDKERRLLSNALD